VLRDVRVPVANLLGEPGKGHKIAFNVLNVGRLKVAATSSGMAKGAFAEAASHAGDFEGTNEINRILIPTILFRRSDAGKLDLWGKTKRAQERMIELEVADDGQGQGEFPLERSLLHNLKVLFLGILGAVAPVRGSQEVMLAVADMVMEIFALESSVVRAGQVCASASDRRQELLRGVVKVAAFERSAQFHLAASRCCAYAGLTTYRTMLRKNLQRLSYYPVEGLLEAKDLLAAMAREAGRYLF
jgi:alkylation response protein AidB-like acyl-CoA dehydrogenase